MNLRIGLLYAGLLAGSVGGGLAEAGGAFEPQFDNGMPSARAVLDHIRQQPSELPMPVAAEHADQPSVAESVRPCESRNPFGICPGDTVYLDGSVGSVQALFPNEKAQVSFSDGSVLVDPRKLVKSLSCYKDICVGNLVINSHKQICLVIQVFANGKIRVRARNARPTKTYRTGYGFRSVTDDPRKFTDADRLTKTQLCFENICEGAKVMVMGGWDPADIFAVFSDQHPVVTVTAVFSNGKIGVLYPGGAAGADGVFESWRVHDAHRLVKVQTVNCWGDICVNDRVLSPSRSEVGRVLTIYSNGKAVVDYGAVDPVMVDASRLMSALK